MRGERSRLRAGVFGIVAGFSEAVQAQFTRHAETGWTLYVSQEYVDQFNADLSAHMRDHNPADGDALEAKCPRCYTDKYWETKNIY